MDRLACWLLVGGLVPPTGGVHAPPFASYGGKLSLKAFPEYSLASLRIVPGNGSRAVISWEKEPAAQVHDTWQYCSDGTIRLVGFERLAIAVNSLGNLDGSGISLQDIRTADPESNRWYYLPGDDTLRLKRYPDYILSVDWNHPLSHGSYLLYHDSKQGAKHRQFHEWVWRPEHARTSSPGSPHPKRASKASTCATIKPSSLGPPQSPAAAAVVGGVQLTSLQSAIVLFVLALVLFTVRVGLDPRTRSAVRYYFDREYTFAESASLHADVSG